jgi:Flp pilus assembly protein TadB
MEDPSPVPEPEPGPSSSGPGSDPVRGTVAVALLVCAALGYLVDRWLGTSPWFTLVGVVLGIAAAVLLTVSRVRRLL